MKKFGFGGKKKPSDGGQDNPYAAQPADNPYAQQPADDPYANVAPARQSPFPQSRSNLPSGPRPGGGGGGLPSGPRGGSGGAYNSPPPPYGGSPAPADTGYANEKFGASGGYGSNRYDNPGMNASRAGGGRQGGYGGLGDNETQRDDLFGGAQARQQQQQQQRPQYGGDNRYGGSGMSGTSGGGDSYGGYGEQRELTEEELEEQEVQNTKDEIKRLNREAESSLDRSLATANQALEVATGSLARLGAQGERLDNTARNLNVAAVHARNAEAKSKELKTLNRSMFAVHVGNPFTAKKRAADEQAAMSAQYQSDKDKQSRLRQEGFANNQRLQSTLEKLNTSTASARSKSGGVSKYTFEADESDEEREANMDVKMDQLGDAVGRLNFASRAIGEVVEKQNTTIDSIRDQADALDTHVQRNNNYLERNFKK